MRWNCPHCKTILVAPEGTAEQKWTFTRCHSCGGFALVKQSRGKRGGPPRVTVAKEKRSVVETVSQVVQKKKVTPPPFHRHLRPVPDPLSQTPKMDRSWSSRFMGRSMGQLNLKGGMVWGTAFFSLLALASILLWMPKIKSVQMAAARASKAAPLQVAKIQTPGVDRIQTQVMAPMRPSLRVKIDGNNVHLRRGPGIRYPSEGQARQGQVFRVTEWEGRWFRLSPEGNSSGDSGWVRNDLLTMMP